MKHWPKGYPSPTSPAHPAQELAATDPLAAIDALRREIADLRGSQSPSLKQWITKAELITKLPPTMRSVRALNRLIADGFITPRHTLYSKRQIFDQVAALRGAEQALIVREGIVAKSKISVPHQKRMEMLRRIEQQSSK
jgi:hypothetical protein